MNTLKYPIIKIGDMFTTAHSGDCVVLAVEGTGTSRSTCTIKFMLTGYTRQVRGSELRKGSVRDPYTPTALGIGFLGEGPHKGNKENEACYNAWRSMLERCYSPVSKIGYETATVDERWHNFQNFASWYKQYYKQGYQLDKDILVQGNTLYSPDTCMYVPRAVNASEAILRGMVKNQPELAPIYKAFREATLDTLKA